MSQNMSSSCLKRIFPYIKPYKHIAALGYFFMLCATATALLLPLIIQNIVNDFSKVDWKIVSIVLALFLGDFCFQSIATYLLSLMGNRVALDIRKELWNVILLKRVKSFDDCRSGEISSRLVNDSYNIVNFISNQIPEMITGVVTLVCSFIIMIYLNVTLTVVMFLLVPLLFIIIIPISNKVAEIAEKQQTLLGTANSYFTERISQIRLIKAYGTEKNEYEKGFEKLNRMYKEDNKGAMVSALLTPLVGTTLTMLLMIVVGVGLYQLNCGLITSGSIVAFFLYFFNCLSPIQTLAGFVVELKEISGSTKELFMLLNDEMEQCEGKIELENSADIRFENVEFGYDEENKVLKGISFEIKRGHQTAIIGESGSGKSTIISLMERFYECGFGNIYCGNIPIGEIELNKWRSLFGYVSQDACIISGTIRENILYGCHRNVTEDELIQIVKMVDLYEFINKQCKKFDTDVGEQGIKLSGGQKQRIAIARALARCPQYLILDESTANLDSVTEENIQKSIEHIINGRTSIIIAHRLATIVSADKIIVLKDGCIVAEGTHEELLQKSNYYVELINKQLTVQEGEIYGN